MSMDEREELLRTLNLITQPQQGAKELVQAELKGEVLRPNKSTDEDEIKSPGRNKGTATEEDTRTGANGWWDAEVTLVEVQTTSESLEKATLNIVDELCNEMSTRGINLGVKDPGRLKTLTVVAPPLDVEVVVQA